MHRFRAFLQMFFSLTGLFVFAFSLHKLSDNGNIGQNSVSLALPPAVIIDAGHGGGDAGAVANGLQEKDLTLEIALRAAQRLRDAGVEARLTRDGDKYLELAERAAFAKLGQGIVFVSIHINSVRTGYGAQGIETYLANTRPLATQAAIRSALPVAPHETARYVDDRDRELAALIQKSVLSATQAKDRGVRDKKNYTVTQLPECPAVLVECGFITNEEEALLLNQRGYRNRLADAIGDGIKEYLSKIKNNPLFGLRYEAASPLPNSKAVVSVQP